MNSDTGRREKFVAGLSDESLNYVTQAHIEELQRAAAICRFSSELLEIVAAERTRRASEAAS